MRKEGTLQGAGILKQQPVHGWADHFHSCCVRKMHLTYCKRKREQHVVGPFRCNSMSEQTLGATAQRGDGLVKSMVAHLAAVCLLAMANVLRVTRWAPRPRRLRTAVCVPVCSSVTHSCLKTSTTDSQRKSGMAHVVAERLRCQATLIHSCLLYAQEKTDVFLKCRVSSTSGCDVHRTEVFTSRAARDAF